MKPEPILEFYITLHAKWMMERRGMKEETIRKVLENPEERRPVRPGREVFQSRFGREAGLKEYLVRVLVETDRHPPEVVTVYRTGKVSKYFGKTP